MRVYVKGVKVSVFTGFRIESARENAAREAVSYLKKNADKLKLTIT